MTARENHRKAHMEFDNWLMSVEQPLSPLRRGEEIQEVIDESERKQHGVKRARSQFPSNSVGNEPQFSPSRSQSVTSLPERKRLKFSETVEFRENYRDSSSYQRSGSTYTRGRYAPVEGSEYLDTSGSTVSFVRFTRMKKIKDVWIEVDEETAAKGNKYTGELRKLGKDIEDKTNQISVRVPNELEGESDSHLDPRSQRLARRSSRMPDKSVPQKQGSVGWSDDSRVTQTKSSRAEPTNAQVDSALASLSSPAQLHDGENSSGREDVRSTSVRMKDEATGETKHSQRSCGDGMIEPASHEDHHQAKSITRPHVPLPNLSSEERYRGVPLPTTSGETQTKFAVQSQNTEWLIDEAGHNTDKATASFIRDNIGQQYIQTQDFDKPDTYDVGKRALGSNSMREPPSLTIPRMAQRIGKTPLPVGSGVSNSIITVDEHLDQTRFERPVVAVSEDTAHASQAQDADYALSHQKNC
ncbi:hypothetical protein ACN47E_000366 [Coniothyrium glycines]